jgi:hypothetical protein
MTKRTAQTFWTQIVSVQYALYCGFTSSYLLYTKVPTNKASHVTSGFLKRTCLETEPQAPSPVSYGEGWGRGHRGRRERVFAVYKEGRERDNLVKSIKRLDLFHVRLPKEHVTGK